MTWVDREREKLFWQDRRYELQASIRGIIAKSLFIDEYGEGETAEEIKTWEKRAIELYYRDAVFNARIDKITYCVMEEVDKYENSKSYLEVSS